MKRRVRGWNVATWGSALMWFGPLSMLGFCVVHGKLTFGRVIASLLRGLAWTALLTLLLWLVDVGFVGRWGAPREKRDVMESFGPIEAPTKAHVKANGPSKKSKRAPRDVVTSPK